MTATKFTPGPWYWVSDASLYSDGIKEFVNFFRVDGFFTKTVSQSMSRHDRSLIAASPDLYAALEAYICAVDDERELGDTCLHDMCRAALAKARGE